MNGLPHRELKSRIAEHPFFQGLAHEFIDLLARNATEQSYNTGDLLIREGEPANEFLLVTNGKVALEVVAPDRPRLTIQTLGPGEVLGWSWITSPYRWRLDGRALKPTKAIVLEAPILREALESHPSDGYQFLLRLLPVIGQRLENTRMQLLDIHGV
jgi:CRP/FNR family transcriptional regulator, cyclic AMP receptor protein